MWWLGGGWVLPQNCNLTLHICHNWLYFVAIIKIFVLNLLQKLETVFVYYLFCVCPDWLDLNPFPYTCYNLLNRAQLFFRPHSLTIKPSTLLLWYCSTNVTIPMIKSVFVI